MTALTDWYPPEVKPVRVGLYETRLVKKGSFIDLPYKCLWNGSQWLTPGGTFVFGQQRRHWRGLAADPKGMK